MSRRGIIEETDPAKCDFCSKEEELRPYGPNNENICHTCAIKDEETTKRKFSEVVLGEYVN